jgi:DNA-binding NarL/FixJ family response regulator
VILGFNGVAMRVLMIDDHVMVLQGLKTLLGAMVPSLQIDTASAIGPALAMTAGVRYDLVLLDWNLDDCNGADAMQRLRDVGCAARIVVLSGDSDHQLVHTAIELGAAGFVPKRYSSEAMLSALDKVLKGGIFLPPDMPAGQALAGRFPVGHVPVGHFHASHPPTEQAAAPPLVEAEQHFSALVSGLTPRQVDVYRAAARGLPNKLIARELGIAEATVKSHLAAVFAVLGVRNRTEAAYHASREGIRVG